MYKLFSNVHMVKGASRTCLCDLQRNTFSLLPSSIAALIDFNGVINVEQLALAEDDLDILNDYINMLVQLDYIFPISLSELAYFPNMSLHFDFPAIISNCILDFSEHLIEHYPGIFASLVKMKCHYLQIRCSEPITLDSANSLIKIMDIAADCSIEFMIPYSPQELFKLLPLLDNSIKVNKVIIYSKDTKKQKANESTFNSYHKTFFVGSIPSIIKSCGQIHRDYFAVNPAHFTESQQHNTCLNRKIAIDANGDIKNCPSMTKSYGNIRDTTLAEAIEKPGFKDVWYIHKDQISVCKDCEFRHICTDCRAYLEDPQDKYSKPLKCGYDPYTCTWEEWSTNPLKQQAIEYYGMQELVKK